MLEKLDVILENQKKILMNQQYLAVQLEWTEEKSKLDQICTYLQRLQGDVNSLRRHNSMLQMRLHDHGMVVNNASGQSTPQRFTLFPNLPPELRARVWMMACFNEPRVLRLHVKSGGVHVRSDGVTMHEETGYYFYCKGYHVPPVLQATKESQAEGCRWYKKRAVNCEKNDRSGIPGPYPHFYFNFDIDILFPVVDYAWGQVLSIEAVGVDFMIDRVVEVVTKHRTLREFHRIAFEIERNDVQSRSQWYYNARFLSKRRSKIEEIFAFDMRADSAFESEQLLYPMYMDEKLPQYHTDESSSLRTVGGDLKELNEILNSEDAIVEDDGEIVEDDPSDDEASAPTSTVGAARGNSDGQESDQAAHAPQPRKPPPKVTFMRMRRRYPIPRPTIRMA